MVFVVTFFKGVIHGVDGDFAVLVALHGVNIGFLDEKENQKETSKDADDDELGDGETFFHNAYYTICTEMFE